MKYTKDQTIDKIKEIGSKVESFNKFNELELQSLLEEVHDYIRNSDISYTEAYKIVKKVTPDPNQFNVSMNRVRNTIWKRDNPKR